MIKKHEVTVIICFCFYVVCEIRKQSRHMCELQWKQPYRESNLFFLFGWNLEW